VRALTLNLGQISLKLSINLSISIFFAYPVILNFKIDLHVLA
jgi:hypothetical protein